MKVSQFPIEQVNVKQVEVGDWVCVSMFDGRALNDGRMVLEQVQRIETGIDSTGAGWRSFYGVSSGIMAVDDRGWVSILKREV